MFPKLKKGKNEDSSSRERGSRKFPHFDQTRAKFEGGESIDTKASSGSSKASDSPKASGSPNAVFYDKPGFTTG